MTTIPDLERRQKDIAGKVAGWHRQRESAESAIRKCEQHLAKLEPEWENVKKELADAVEKEKAEKENVEG